MQIINPIPNDVYLACSGGIDSMFVYHFLKAGRKNVVCLFFNHGTTASAEAEEFLKLIEKDLPKPLIAASQKLRTRMNYQLRESGVGHMTSDSKL